MWLHLHPQRTMMRIQKGSLGLMTRATLIMIAVLMSVIIIAVLMNFLAVIPTCTTFAHDILISEERYLRNLSSGKPFPSSAGFLSSPSRAGHPSLPALPLFLPPAISWP